VVLVPQTVPQLDFNYSSNYYKAGENVEPAPQNEIDLFAFAVDNSARAQIPKRDDEKQNDHGGANLWEESDDEDGRD